MQFAHIADVHLGAKLKIFPEKYLDHRKAFENAVNTILQENVDFVLISGDLFDAPTLNPSSISQAIELLEKLAEKDIPVIAIAGNHEITKSISPITFLETQKLLINIGIYSKEILDITKPLSPRNFQNVKVQVLSKEISQNAFLLYVMLTKGTERVIIKGLQYYPKYLLEQIFKDTDHLSIPEEPLPTPDTYNIFLGHFIIKNLYRKFEIEETIDKTLLPTNYNYFAMGHLHKHIEYFDEGVYYVYPGSIQPLDFGENTKEIYIDLNDMDNIKTELQVPEANKNGFVIVNTKKKDPIKFYETKIRDYINVTVDLSKNNLEYVKLNIVKILNLIEKELVNSTDTQDSLINLSFIVNTGDNSTKNSEQMGIYQKLLEIKTLLESKKEILKDVLRAKALVIDVKDQRERELMNTSSYTLSDISQVFTEIDKEIYEKLEKEKFAKILFEELRKMLEMENVSKENFINEIFKKLESEDLAKDIRENIRKQLKEELQIDEDLYL